MGYYVPPPLPSVYAAPPRRVSMFRRVVAWGCAVVMTLAFLVIGVCCFAEYAAKAVSVVMR